MVTLFVFYIHTVAAVYAFTDQCQEEGVGAGTLAVAFMGIVFSVGWSISSLHTEISFERKRVRHVLQQRRNIPCSPDGRRSGVLLSLFEGDEKEGAYFTLKLKTTVHTWSSAGSALCND